MFVRCHQSAIKISGGAYQSCSMEALDWFSPWSAEMLITNNDEQWKFIFERIISRYKDYSVCSICETQGSQSSHLKRENLFFVVFCSCCRRSDSRSCPLSQTWLSFSLITKCCTGVVRGGMEPFRLSLIIYRTLLTLTAVQSQQSFIRSVILKFTFALNCCAASRYIRGDLGGRACS